MPRPDELRKRKADDSSGYGKKSKVDIGVGVFVLSLTDIQTTFNLNKPPPRRVV